MSLFLGVGMPWPSAAAPVNANDALIRELASSDAKTRQTALNRGEDWTPGPPAAIPVLARLAVQDPEFAIRNSASLRLRGMGSPARSAVPSLVAALKSPHADQRAHAIQALGWLGPLAESAVDDIARAYSDTSSQVKFVAGEALFAIRHPTAASLAALVAELHDADMPAALNASTALGALGEPAVPLIAPCLGDPSPMVRLYALYALQSIGAPATGLLIAALRDSSAVVRGAAVVGLVRLNPRTDEVKRALESAANDPDPELRALMPALLQQSPAAPARSSSGNASH